MVHKNYKWNLSKEKGRRLIFNMIDTILKERKDQKIHIDELHFLLNNRTKNTNIMKVVYGGLIKFLDDYDEFMLKKVNDGYIVELNNIESNDWIIVRNV